MSTAQLAYLVTWSLIIIGCEPAGWVAGVIVGGTKTVTVPAQYRGLDNRSVAVLVATPNTMLYQHPDAPLKIVRAITTRIATEVPGTSVSNPLQTTTFQRENATWTGVPPKQLLNRLAVQRIIMVDLAEYSTHDPGNAHIFRGVISGKIGVFEAENDDPNNFVYTQTVVANYPPGGGIRLLQEDVAMIELGTLELFADRVTGLFHDHKVIRE